MPSLPRVYRFLSALTGLLLALLAGGCGERERLPLPPEIEDPFYVQGKQLQKQGRPSEALNAFLKVIDRRGESPSPESHLEAGLICLYHTKDFPAAYYHLRRYHKAQPNSKEAPLVLGKIEEAKREFARTLPGRPLDDQSLRLAMEDEVHKLRRENEELRAELSVIRGGGVTPTARGPRMIALPDEVRVGPVRPPAVAVAPEEEERPPLVTPAPALVSPAPAVTAAPPRPAPEAARPAARAAGRTHTVAPKDTLYSISRRYQVRVEDIVAANPALLPRASTPLRVGTTLRIP
ncbi:MAG: LysM peptidoglycan-binding domain-containing protein [Verrucomicrobia bacterium]|nr:LysM peptidoglycan-binding domain-containing protein [Verrucomicrobiota bacterium]